MRHLVAGIALLMSIMAAGPVVAQQPRRAYRIGVLTEAWAANHPTGDGLKAGLRKIEVVAAVGEIIGILYLSPMSATGSVMGVP